MCLLGKLIPSTIPNSGQLLADLALFVQRAVLDDADAKARREAIIPEPVLLHEEGEPTQWDVDIGVRYSRLALVCLPVPGDVLRTFELTLTRCRFKTSCDV